MSHREAWERYLGELDDIQDDRAMAARFNSGTTAAWLVELDREERMVRKALFRLRGHADRDERFTPSVSPPPGPGGHERVRRCA